MKPPATYLPPRALIRRRDAIQAVAAAQADAEKYRQLLLRAIRNTPPPALPSITPTP